MTFQSPELLWLCALLPLLPWMYVLAIRRKKAAALKFTNMALIKEASEGRRSWRRHVPPVLLFLALAVLFVAIARPSAFLALPSERTTVILALDVSGSMRARDVAPSRMVAAIAAARQFVKDQPRNTRIGLVAFSTSAMIMQSPTLVHQEVIDAIEGLRPQRFTAVGSGIVASLQAIYPDLDIDMARLLDVEPEPLGEPLDGAKPRVEPPKFQPVAPGSNTSAVVILLSDGRTNVGVDPMEAARMAAERGVRVFTIGFGSADGAVDFGGGMMRTQLDEEALKMIAEMTGAKYFLATSEEALKEVYGTVSAQFVSEAVPTEVTGIAAAAALLPLLLAGLLSLLWSNRIA
ncbi:MAG: VWA domain-containing protein [Rhodospirillaceae bacterium]|nr:VWA domain-containing protein [Rhodospirillaceae bacterium]